MFNHLFSLILVAILTFALTLTLAMEVILLTQFGSVALAVGQVIIALAILNDEQDTVHHFHSITSSTMSTLSPYYSAQQSPMVTSIFEGWWVGGRGGSLGPQRLQRGGRDPCCLTCRRYVCTFCLCLEWPVFMLFIVY